MGTGEGARSTGRFGPTGPTGSARIPSSTWYVVAGIGALLLLLGMWNPAWKGVPDGVLIGYLLDVAGGVLIVVGLTYGYDARTPKRQRIRIEDLPGVEVFSPGAPVPAAGAGDSDSASEAGGEPAGMGGHSS